MSKRPDPPAPKKAKPAEKGKFINGRWYGKKTKAAAPAAEEEE
jgi:hypothetical protein